MRDHELTRVPVQPAFKAIEVLPSERQAVDILIVDDNEGKLLALETALAPLGENIICAMSGRQALHHLLSRQFATVILDVNMPDLDGFETARMIRSRPRSASTPIIFISAVNMDEADVFRGYSLGAVDYICAPILPEVLRAKVSVFVELHRKSEEARMQAERLQERTRELEQSQRELRLSERMASIGTLCAGLGHDMGNLLLPASVWVDTLQPDKLPEDLQEGVQNLCACIKYLRKLAGGLRLVSLDPAQDIGDRHVQLRKWMDEVAPILRNALPRGISLKIEIPEDLPPVRIAPHRLAQAAFNLVQNAGEALRGRQDGLVRLWASAERSGVRIGVSDNGPGMSREVLEHCLDPFFTTKTRGISTGLGLSLVHGIVQTAGSSLDVSSSGDKGTTFSFLLQPAEEAIAECTPAIVTAGDSRTRAIAASLLKAAGCEVVDELPTSYAGAAVWVTDCTDEIDERARAFKSAGAERQVFVIGDGTIDSKEARVTTLTGPNGLASEIRRFLTRRRSTEPKPRTRAPAVAGATADGQ